MMDTAHILGAIVATYFLGGAAIYFIVGLTGNLWRDDGLIFFLIFFWPILLVVAVLTAPFFAVRYAGRLGDWLHDHLPTPPTESK